MPKVGEIIAGAALIAGAVVLDVTTAGAALGLTAAEISMLATVAGSMGTSLAMAGVSGLLAGLPTGHSISSQNPIKPWDIAYGQVKVGGTFVYIESNGGILSNGSNTYDKCTNFVIMLAAHPIQSVDQVRLNGKAIPLGPGGSGAQNTTWTFTPPTNQNQTNIASIRRASGVVTIKLVSGLSDQNGLQFNVQFVNDATFNGVFTVTQPDPLDDTTFTYLCGGADTTASGGYIYTCYPDYKNRVHCDLTSCLGNHSSTFPELLATSTLWTPAHKNLGKASVYLAFYYDADVFANGLPQSSFIISGKNDIYDPRLGDITDPATYVYTNNAALVIADYLSNKVWGYGMEYGTDIPLPQLIAAANICDEAIPLAAGGTEPRYTINMTFALSRGRGEVLQDMLNACAGRITFQSGQYIIVPGAWVGPFISLDKDNLVGPIEYKPILTMRDVSNGVKGTYMSPVNNWQAADIPPYAEDATHGYAADQWLAADNGVRLWKDVSFPATTSCPTAQRLAKIDLERTRREGKLTLHCDMSAYPCVALDVAEFTHSRYGWNGKTFEVLSSRLIVQADSNGGAPTLSVDLSLTEVDSDIYDWSTSEELTPADNPSPAITNNGQIVSGPQTLVIESGPSTTYVGADGIALPRILAAWEVSPSATVQSGGYFHVEYQKQGDAFWTPAGTVSGMQTQCYIGGVVAGQNYSVQVQAFTASGVSSGWSQAGPITVSATSTFMAASNVKYPDGTPVGDLQPATAGADITSVNIPTDLLTNGSFELGLTGWTPSATPAIDKTQKRYGQQSAKFHGSQLLQTISLKARHTYSAQGWVKTNGSVVGNGSSGAGFYFFDPNQYIKVQKTNGTAINLTNVFPGVVLAASVATDWTQIQYTFSVSTDCALNFSLSDTYGAQTALNAPAWFDGFSLIDLTGGPDVTASQALAHTGASGNLIPNGTFLLGNIDGWGGTGVYNSGGILLLSGGAAFSPTFNVVPGQKYRFSFTGQVTTGGTQVVYHRVFFGSLYAPNITDGGIAGYVGLFDFVAGGSLVPTLATYNYDWTCPAGVYYASLAMYELGTAGELYTNVSAIEYGASAEWGSDKTLNQPIVYTGLSANLVPNGDFILGNIDGWANIQGAGGSYSAVSTGGSIFLAAGAAVASPSFSTIPGQKYRFTWEAWAAAGSQCTYFRIHGAPTFAPSILSGASYFTDFLGCGSIVVGANPGQAYTYDWTCPAGVYYVSMVIYANGVAVAVGRVIAQDYGAAGEWGIGNGVGTVGGIINQGGLATLDQTNTVNIVANAVSSQIVYTSTVQVIAPANGTDTVVAQQTITTGGGYVKVSVSMNLGAAGVNYPVVTLRRGGATGPAVQTQNNVAIGFPGNASVGFVFVDTSFGLAQQYTVTVNSGFSLVTYCNQISLIAENMKV